MSTKASMIRIFFNKIKIHPIHHYGRYSVMPEYGGYKQTMVMAAGEKFFF